MNLSAYEEYCALAEERDVIEQLVADGDLCSADGRECDWVNDSDLYGADRDGNRGVWMRFKRCRKCGEER